MQSVPRCIRLPTKLSSMVIPMLNRSLHIWAAILLAIAPAQCFAFTYFKRTTLPTNYLVYDPISDMIYASVPSSAGALRGNTITAINPHTGFLGTSVFISSEPSVLALADDGSRVYAASESTNLVTPFNLSTMTSGTPFVIGSGNRRVDDMEVAPGAPTVLAVSRSFGGNNVGIAIFADGVKLPNEQSDSAINDVIEFGDNANTLYGHENSVSDFDFNSFSIDTTPTGGITSGYQSKYLLTQFGLDMEYESGRMYFTNGQILEVTTPGPIGSFTANGPVEPVGSVGRTYFVQGTKLKSFSQATFVPLGEITIPGMIGTAKNLISLGDNGLAFATTSGQIIIARGSLVKGPTADFDADGDVDGQDFIAWQAGVGKDTALRADGDSNGDGIANAEDLAFWKQQFGKPATTVASVPEPNSVALAVYMLTLASRFRRS